MPRGTLARVAFRTGGPVALVEERAVRGVHGVVALAGLLLVPRNAVALARGLILLEVAFGRRRSNTALAAAFAT